MLQYIVVQIVPMVKFNQKSKISGYIQPSNIT